MYILKCNFIFLPMSVTLAANVWQARLGGLSKHRLTLTTKGILKIITLLVSRK